MILFQKNQKKDNTPEDKLHGLLSELCEKGLLCSLIDDYLCFCHSTRTDGGDEGTKSKNKIRTLFPNLAGFCRYLNTGLSDIPALAADFPDEYDKLLAIFEDEALNAEVSPTLLSAYLKKRMLYMSESQPSSREVRYCFEHDIFSDGE